MRMLWRSILSAVLLVTLAQSTPLRKSSAQTGSDGSIPPVSKENGYSLPKNVQPDSYTIKLEPHLVGNDFTFKGESNIDVNITGPATKTIVLHAVDLAIEEEFTSLVTIDGKTALKPTKQSLEPVKEFLTIEFADPIAAGAYTLNLRYTGKLKEDPKGFYRSQRQIHGGYVWEALTRFKPSYARRAFPCFDEPAMTAWFSIYIKRSEHYVANSTALVVKRTDDGDKSWTQSISGGLVSTDDIEFKVAYEVNSRWSYPSTYSPIYPSTTDSWWGYNTSTTGSWWGYNTSTTDSWWGYNTSTTDSWWGYNTSTTDSWWGYNTSTTDSWWGYNTSTTPEIIASTTPPAIPSPIPPTNQKCIHATYVFQCTQCRPLINVSLS